MLRFFAIVGGLGCVWLAPAPSSAQTILDAAQGIEARIAAGDSAAAMAEAQSLLQQVWDTTQAIGFTEAVLVAEPASGYGIYNRRASISYTLDQSIYVYAEPYGYGFGSPGEGLHSIGFFVDLQVVAADGSVLGVVPDVAQIDLVSREQIREMQATITYDLGGIAPGTYTLLTTLRDKNSAKSGSFETQIEIVP